MSSSTAQGPSPFRVRPAEPTDGEAVTAVLRAAGTLAWSSFLGAARVEAGLRETWVQADLVAEAPETGSVVGFVGWDDRTGEIAWLHVHPDWQGRGIGTTLLERAMQALADAGLGEAWLHTERRNLGALGFYERRGWRLDGPVRVRPWHGVTLLEPRFVHSLPAA